MIKPQAQDLQLASLCISLRHRPACLRLPVRFLYIVHPQLRHSLFVCVPCIWPSLYLPLVRLLSCRLRASFRAAMPSQLRASCLPPVPAIAALLSHCACTLPSTNPRISSPALHCLRLPALPPGRETSTDSEFVPGLARFAEDFLSRAVLSLCISLLMLAACLPSYCSSNLWILDYSKFARRWNLNLAQHSLRRIACGRAVY